MVVREDVLVQVGVMVVEREEESQVTGKGGRGVVCQVLDVLAQVEMGMVAQAVGQVLVRHGQSVVCQVLGVLAQVEVGMVAQVKMGMVAQVVGQALVHQTFVQTLCLAQVHH